MSLAPKAGRWTFPAIAIGLWAVVIGYPLLAAIRAVFSEVSDAAGIHQTAVGTSLFWTSTLWAIGVALLSAAVGWLPGRVLGRALCNRGFVPLVVALLLPVCLPASVVFYAWWQAWPADSWLYRWAVEHEMMTEVRRGTLGLALTCWSWPLVAWCVAGEITAKPAEQDDMLDLDAASFPRRLLTHLRSDATGLAIGVAVVFLVTFNNTTCFDLAQIFTYGNELRAMEALGARPAETLRFAGGPILLTGIAAVGIWCLLFRRPDVVPHRIRPPARSMAMTSLLIWAVSILVPLVLLVRGLPLLTGGFSDFRQLHGGGMLNALSISAVTGLLAGIMTLVLALAWMCRTRIVHRFLDGLAITWFLAAAVPAMVVATALEVAWNVPLAPPELDGSDGFSFGHFASETHARLAEFMYGGPAILVLAHLARFGVVAALLSRWCVLREPKAHAEFRSLEAGDSLRGVVRSAWPRFLAASAAAAAITAVLSLGEIPIANQLRPPGFDLITASMLNDMHYQRPQTVIVGVTIILAIAIGAATMTAIAWRMLSGRATLLAGLGLVLIGVGSGCEPQDPRGTALRTEMMFGSPGRGLGQFVYPRAIAVDPDAEKVYVIDKSARVQRFDADGTPELAWDMPARENGKPTGISVAPDGTVFVADTHYFQIVAYDSDGREQMRFGEYGTGPGQFIYPTDIAFAPDGRLFVAEYGGNDRIQIFSPEGEFLSSFGSFGEDPEQFNRPQSIAFNQNGTELYIADSCHHRIVVTDLEGNILRTFGTLGDTPGQFAYPYGLAMLRDGSLLVCEFGNNRIQHVTAEGRSLGVYGRVGRGSGELQYPWNIAVSHQRVFILDSGNNRVQIIDSPA